MGTDASPSPPRGEDVVRRAFAANNRGDVDGFLEWLDPDVEWASAGLFLYPAQVWRGRERVREALLRAYEQRGGLEHVTLREIAERDGELLVIGVVSTTGARRPVTLPIAWIMSVRAGKVVQVRGFSTEQQA